MGGWLSSGGDDYRFTDAGRLAVAEHGGRLTEAANRGQLSAKVTAYIKKHLESRVREPAVQENELPDWQLPESARVWQCP
jgi:hypothetical protein